MQYLADFISSPSGESQQKFKSCINISIPEQPEAVDVIIRHINPLMFYVIDDKPEGVARGVYHV